MFATVLHVNLLSKDRPWAGVNARRGASRSKSVLKMWMFITRCAGTRKCFTKSEGTRKCLTSCADTPKFFYKVLKIRGYLRASILKVRSAGTQKCFRRCPSVRKSVFEGARLTNKCTVRGTQKCFRRCAVTGISVLQGARICASVWHKLCECYI